MMTKHFDVTWAQSDEELLESERLLGMFMCWAVQRGLTSEFSKFEPPDLISKLLNRVDTGGFFFSEASELCCGKLNDEDLVDQAAAFAEHYFRVDAGSRRNFFHDVRGIVKKLPEDRDSWELYDRFATVLDKRYAAWQKPWWRVW